MIAAEVSRQHYVTSVAAAVGLPADAWYYAATEPAEAYLALERRSARFPDFDLALIWDPGTGWAAALEAGEDLIIVSYYGERLFPAPHRVAAFIAGIRQGGTPGQIDPPRFPRAVRAVRTRAYAHSSRQPEKV